MGCSASMKSSRKIDEQHRNINILKATVLIQTWFRRHQARLEARRRCTWKIFQAIEYSGEQDQIKLCNFFNELLSDHHLQTTTDQSLTNQDRLLDIYADPLQIEIGPTYSGPEISIPIDLNSIWKMIEDFQKGQVLHEKYVLLILHHVKDKLRHLPNIRNTTTSISRQITICGDLHGSFVDLMVILEKNGAPSRDNPYIFNGDLVDRGTQSVEVVLIVFAFYLLYPDHVFINRGNHEDYIMNSRYGFLKEIMKKYKNVASKILRVIDDVFSWLPLATIVNGDVLVVHGGVSSLTNLKYLDTINRQKYVSVLKPSFLDRGLENIDLGEWRQMLDILWSDPRSNHGCSANTFRGGGCYFGPDVTNKFLEMHDLKLLVRSHECVLEGYKTSHNGKVVTVFSASNYYEKGSNKGAYMKIIANIKPYFVQFSVSEKHINQTNQAKEIDRLSKIEASAMSELRKIIYSRKELLLKEFRKRDQKQTGILTILEWGDVMESVLEISLPWIMILNQISIVKKDGKIDYESSLDRYHIEAMCSKKGNIVETLYRHRNTFETIFRVMDKNNSGLVSLEEFQEGCEILSDHTKCLSKQDIKDLALTIDINKDGKIDFNEFLEAFRLCETTTTITKI